MQDHIYGIIVFTAVSEEVLLLLMITMMSTTMSCRYQYLWNITCLTVSTFVKCPCNACIV